MDLRVKLLFFFVLALFGTAIVRLFYWQIIKGEELSEMARMQYRGGRQLVSPRGEIFSSDGSWLVATEDAWLVFANPKEIEGDKEKLAEKLAEILIESEDKDLLLQETLRINKLLNKSESSWVPLASKINKNQKLAIDELSIKGLGFEEQDSRMYPEASIAAHLVGFVGKDESGRDKGYFGLEGYYDLMLSGTTSFTNRESDARGVPIFLSGNTTNSFPANGIDLTTSIDKTIQINVERNLRIGVEQYGASGGSVVVMNPNTGAVLAMSAMPSFDPAKYTQYGDAFFKNPIISSSYEPGSIFKVLVMAAALDAGLVNPDTKCPICSGPYKVGKYSIGTWNDEYHPDATMTEIIVDSDNVGMSYVGSLLGKDRMYDYLDRFGIGRLTGIDLQGEAAPKLREKGTWNDVDLATSSFGQGVAVTSIQMLRSVAAIANGGIMPIPRVVEKVSFSDWEENINPKFEDRVISEKAAKEIAGIMAEAATHGESKWTYLKGFKIAGKTGTAQIPIEGHYDPDQTIASFVGFAPYDDPKFVMIVTLVKPQSSPWASETSAPLWYKIAKGIFDYYGIQPDR